MSRAADWPEELPAAITVCDAAGTILEMNQRAAATFVASVPDGLPHFERD